MNVREIMASIVQKVNPEDSLYKAARIMKEYDIGCVLVADDGSLLGVITDRDLVLRGLANPAALSGTTIADVMTPEPVCCSVDDTVNQAAAIMEVHRIRRLPVLDFHRKLCGIVTLGEICTHAPHDVSGELIEEVSWPGHSCLAESA